MLILLLAIAFYTLFERKLLSLSQTRLGPNQVLLGGLLQPVLDGVKLLLKEWYYPLKGRISFLLIPPLLFMSSFLLYLVLPSFQMIISYRLLFLLMFIGFIVYSNMLRGWLSYSKYSSLGRVRRVRQSIRYEILLTLLLLRIVGSLIVYREKIYLLRVAIWLLCILRECNRHPFDFAEGERELIRGFNVEYGRSGFVLLFLSEYGIIILFSLIREVFFSIGLLVLIFFILSRSVLPRFRYDKLIRLIWLIRLPLICYLLIISIYLYLI